MGLEKIIKTWLGSISPLHHGDNQDKTNKWQDPHFVLNLSMKEGIKYEFYKNRILKFYKANTIKF